MLHTSSTFIVPSSSTISPKLECELSQKRSTAKNVSESLNDLMNFLLNSFTIIQTTPYFQMRRDPNVNRKTGESITNTSQANKACEILTTFSVRFSISFTFSPMVILRKTFTVHFGIFRALLLLHLSRMKF